MYIDSQFPPLCVFHNAIGLGFWTLRIFSGAKHDRHVVVACRPSKIARCMAAFGVVSPEIARCNIELMPPENHTDTIGHRRCALRNDKFHVRRNVPPSFASLTSDRFLFFRVNVALIWRSRPSASIERVRRTKRKERGKKDRFSIKIVRKRLNAPSYTCLLLLRANRFKLDFKSSVTRVNASDTAVSAGGGRVAHAISRSFLGVYVRSRPTRRHPQPAFPANSSSNNYRTDDGGRGGAEDELVVTWRPGAQHYVITVERACAGSEDDTMDHGLACPLMHDIAESVPHASANMSRASRNC